MTATIVAPSRRPLWLRSRRIVELPGNVRLRKGEGGLPKPSVVNVTQVSTVDKARLTERLGRLNQERLLEVLSGLSLVFGTEQASEHA